MNNAHTSHENANYSNTENNPNDFAEAMADLGEFRPKFPGIKQIEQMDFENLTEDDEKLLCDTVARYFTDKFGKYEGVTERIEKYKNSVNFLHHGDFLEDCKRKDPNCNLGTWRFYH